MTIMTIHKHDQKHLEHVKKIAAEIGEVKIKAYYDGETMYCLEGVHRVQAAKELQIPVVFYTVDWEDYIETDIADSGNLECDEEGRASVESIFEYAYGNPYGCQGNVYDESEFVSIKKV